MRGGNDEEFLTIFIVIMLIAIAIGLTVAIFFYLTLSRCLSRVQPHNRDMEPGQVWLNFIPCFGMVWIFITILRIASSLRKEFEDRGWRSDSESYGQNVGLGYAICALLGAIPYIGFIFSLASLVCFIMYWVQIANFSRQLMEPYEPRRRRFDDEEDDLDDDRPLLPRQRKDDENGPPDERIRASD